MDIELFTPKARKFLAKVAQQVRARTPREIADHVEDIVFRQDQWRGRACLNMNPAEGLLSQRARRVLASDMATRATEGVPGDKTFPHNRQNDFVDELEATAIGLIRQRFGARFVEWRHPSNSLANAGVFFSLLANDDVMLVQGLDGGGNYSYQTCGPAGLRTSRIFTIAPMGSTFEIDLEDVDRQARKLRPRMIVVGGGKVLFPYPLKELRKIADSVGAYLVLDAAHMGLFIAYGEFQRPLDEGAHVVTLSTHKVFGGPVGGLILTNDAEIAAKVMRITFPGLIQTRDLNKYAALCVTLAELEQYGCELARRMVANARVLAGVLEEGGFSVLSRDGCHTQTHQVFLHLGEGAQAFERRCHEANILLPDCALTGDAARKRRSGARLAVHELSRRGMAEKEMVEVAGLIKRASRGKDETASVAADVADLLGRFPTNAFGFDEGEPFSASGARSLDPQRSRR